MKGTEPTHPTIQRRNLIIHRFGIAHLAYTVALVAAAIAFFGTPGIFVAGVALIGWLSIFGRSKVSPGCAALTVLLILGVGLVVLPVIIFMQKPRSNHDECASNMAQLASAYLRLVFESERKHSFEEHSWRVMILPFLGEQDLYHRYRFDEPWDSEHNRQLIAEMPEVFRCPGHESATMTSYFLVRHEGKLPSFRFGKLVMVEDHHQAVPWTKPHDITPTEALELFRNPYDRCPHVSRDGVSETYYGRNAVGSSFEVVTVPPTVPLREMEPYLDKTGNRQTLYDTAYSHIIPSRLDSNSLVSGIALVLLVLMPICFIHRDVENASEVAGPESEQESPDPDENAETE